MKKLTLFLLAVLGTHMLSVAKSREAVVLTDENFEQLTQASTSADTGDWLVLFCEMERFPKKCGHLKPLWDELAEVLYGKTTVAYVDV